MSRNRNPLLYLLPIGLLLVTLSCSLPSLLQRGKTTPSATVGQVTTLPGKPTKAPTEKPPQPTPTPQPLPPAIVESNPSPKAELSLLSPVTFYFNQPMQRDTVEAALSVQPAVDGSFSWSDDATLVFQPAAPLSPESEVVFTVNPGAKAANGLTLDQPVSLEYQTAGFLELTQILPEPGAYDVDPQSAVVVAFNRPVVPLGADPAGLPPAFSLDPLPSGAGKWLNTSTYIFYPDPQFEGGKTYNVRLNQDLRSMDGSPLAQVDEPLRPANEWSFITAEPRLATIDPDPERTTIRLDAKFVLTFNQPMDPQSVEANFSLLEAGSNPISGGVTWNETYTEMTFTPDNLLVRDTDYSLQLAGDATARGGTPLGSSFTAMYRTVPSLSVVSTDPPQGGVKPNYQGISIFMSGPVLDKNLEDYVRLEPYTPNLQVYWSEYDRILSISGDVSPAGDYTLTISPDLPDPWGGTMGEEYVLRFQNGSLSPNVSIMNSGDAIFITGNDTTLTAQVTNISNLSLSLGSVPLEDFINLVSGENSYEERQRFQPADQVTWQQNLEVAPNISQRTSFYIQPDQSALSPGLYFLRFNDLPGEVYSGPYLMVVSDVQVLFKLAATEALVWAVNMDGFTPVADAPVAIYDSHGQVLATGQTDEQGIFHEEIPVLKDPYSTYYAVVGAPGDANFGMALSSWSMGVAPWDFGISGDIVPPQLDGYLYTDRPIYRPGQTVYFRAAMREAYNGRYSDPGISTVPLALYYGDEVASFDLPLSKYGTAHGEYTLPVDAKPGYYRLSYKPDKENTMVNMDIYFQVAEYRKPEIDVQVEFTADEALISDTLTANVDANYFFGAPATDVPLNWTLMTEEDYVYLPGYEMGISALSWMENAYRPHYPWFSRTITSGEARTDANGKLVLEFPPGTDPYAEPGSRQNYTLEVTLTDESGQPVSARDSIVVHPSDFYIGVQPESWVGRAGEESDFKIQVVDWDGNPAGERSLRADFQKVVWEKDENTSINPYAPPTFTALYTPIGSTDFNTDADGRARLAFTPPEPGTYLLDVGGGGARTAVLYWVGGPGQVVWPSLPNNRIELSANQEEYLPGDTAQVFVPNPFSQEVPALVTIERGIVSRYQIVRLAAGGQTMEFPLTGEDAPNVYLSVTILGTTPEGQPDFRMGYMNLPVKPVEQTFNVQLVSQPEKTGPGDEVTFDIQVTDADGQPVQGEFSLSVVDQAVLALADPNAPDIREAFYGNQMLGVRTGSSLAAYPNRGFYGADGMGGGGGEAVTPYVREQFEDTAFWNAEIVTDEEGRARVTMTLPDNLTTWQVLARGLTEDTRVGQAETELLTTKDLLMRPVVPRFLVAGDHVQLAAIVQNNTNSDLDVQANLQANGVILDDPASASQTVFVPAGSGARLEWWGRAQDVESVDLLFSAEGGGLSDAARPANGSLPVLHYTAPQTFSTAGIVAEGGEQLEQISLPRSYDPTGGQLDVELASSLTGAMASALEVLEHYPYESTEATLSHFLPNLETYRMMQEFGTISPEVEARLKRTLDDGLQSLVAGQNNDGGWGWWTGMESDPYISAYVLFGLTRAQEAGAAVSENTLQRAIEYLRSTLYTPKMSSETWQLDRLAFIHYALAQAGAGDLAAAQALYDVRDQLSPWGAALTALIFDQLAPESQEARSLFSDLESTALRSATGAHWEEEAPGFENLTSALTTSAIVTYALAQHDPASPLLADAARYLVLNRGADGAWSSTYENAWALLALNQVIRGTGDLMGSFAFGASLNGTPLATGQAEGQSGAVKTSVPVSQLYPQDPNALLITREAGPGRLFYNAALNVVRPVEDVESLGNGISIQRAYYPQDESCTREDCPAIQGARSGDLVEVRLTLSLEEAAYHLMLEDFIPAGAEILNESLKTTQQVIPEGEQPEPPPLYDPSAPLADGWGWWLFNSPQVYDDRIAWAVDYLPAGTYELTYVMSMIQPGEYQVLPARAWQSYFPEVQGNSAGEIFAIQP